MLHYRTWAPDGEVRGKLLLLHDAGGSTVTFRVLAPQLAAAGYAVLAVDLPGFGFSDQALDFEHSLENRSGLVWSLADRLDTEENSFPPADSWIVAGHGMGGRVAAQMAVDRPARTRGLVLVASDITGATRPGAWYWFPPYRWALESWLHNSVFTIEGVEELLSDAYGRPATREEVELYAAPLLRPRMARAFVRYSLTAGRLTFSPETIETSTLLIWGAQDTWSRPDFGEQADARLPRSTLARLEDAGHIPMETHPEATEEIVLAWLERL